MARRAHALDVNGGWTCLPDQLCFLFGCTNNGLANAAKKEIAKARNAASIIRCQSVPAKTIESGKGKYARLFGMVVLIVATSQAEDSPLAIYPPTLIMVDCSING